MTRHRWNRDALPWLQTHLAPARELDRKTSVNDYEKLIGGGVKVPTISFLEHREAQATIVHTVDYHVSIALGDGSTLCREIHDVKGRISDRFLYVLLRCEVHRLLLY
jgi:hypothetical protein